MPTRGVTDSDGLIGLFEGHLRHQRGLSHNTVRAYSRDVAHLAQHLMDSGHAAQTPSTEDIDAALEATQLRDLRAWLAAMAQAGLSRTTLARRGAAVRTFFAWAHQAGQ